MSNAMKIDSGKRYFGPFDAARIVTSADASSVSWISPGSLAPGESSRAAFEAWAAGSGRRNYTHEDGERRIKLAATEPIEDEAGEQRPAGVSWVPVDHPNDLRWSTAAEWAAWRADAE